MFRLVAIFVFLCVSLSTFSQNKTLNDFSFVVVPTDYDFLSRADQYQLNSMTKFYLEKAGFNVFLSNELPNAEACDGLYAVVEKLPAFMLTKVQVTLNDCKGNEIYKSIEGKSKLKEHEKSYQDALRKAMSGLSMMRIKQKQIKISPEKVIAHDSKPTAEVESSVAKIDVETPRKSESALPTAKFSNYTLNGKSFLLRKVQEGYSLYEETGAAKDELSLLGKIIVLGENVKYMDDAGAVSDVSFDAAGNMTLKDGNTSTVYKKEN